MLLKKNQYLLYPVVSENNAETDRTDKQMAKEWKLNKVTTSTQIHFGALKAMSIGFYFFASDCEY